MKISLRTAALMLLFAFAVFSGDALSAPAGKKPKAQPAKKPAVRKTAKKIPAGAFVLDVNPDSKSRRPGGSLSDSGKFSFLLDDGALWIGRRGGVRRYDTATGAWKFFQSNGCEGIEAVALAKAAGKIWALFNPDGRLCILDPATGQWHKPESWRMRTHIFGGAELLPFGNMLLVGGKGSPDSEGISVVDPAREEWVNLFRTKPSTVFKTDGKSIWAGVPEGILRIDAATGGYRYFTPSEHGCGAETTSIEITPAGVFAGTVRSLDARIGFGMGVFKNGFSVMTKRMSGPYMYRWIYYERSNRKKLERDIANATIDPMNIKTNGGLCRWDGKAWAKVRGLPGDNITALASSGGKLFAGTERGTAVIDIKNLKTLRVIKEASSPNYLAAASGALWISKGTAVYKVPFQIDTR